MDEDPWQNQPETLSELVSVRMPGVFKSLTQSDKTVISTDANRQSTGNMKYLLNRNKKLFILEECIAACFILKRTWDS